MLFMKDGNLRSSQNGTGWTDLSDGRIAYNTVRSRAYRHLDYYIIQTLESESAKEFKIDNLRLGLERETGVRFQEQTLRRYLERYLHRNQGGPFFAGTDKDSYTWNCSDFKSQKIRPPRNHPTNSPETEPQR